MNDVELLAKLILCEAGGEGDIGMKAVASVVMNRVNINYGEYARYNTISEVIFQPYQFVCAMETVSGVYNPQNLFNMRVTDEAVSIAEWAILGNRITNLGLALWFFNPFTPSCPPNFPSDIGYFYIKIVNHCFYNPTESYSKT